MSSQPSNPEQGEPPMYLLQMEDGGNKQLYVQTCDEDKSMLAVEIHDPDDGEFGQSLTATLGIDEIRELHARLGKWLCDYDYPA